MSTHFRVLVVDDSPLNLKLARVALEGCGYDVMVANDGEEAWSLLSHHAPALILMDLQMPGIDGFELTRRIKADPEKRMIKVVAVTAYAMKGDRERAIAAGCDGYIAKPIDPLLLPGLIASYLGAQPTSGDVELPSDPIVVIEDNPTSRKMIRVTLESEGYIVQEFAEARAALSWIATARPRMILQDLVLPDIDGLELLDALRALPQSAHIPILCLSGFLARIEEAKLRSYRFSAHLAKPVDPIQLLATVREHLDRPQTLPPSFMQKHAVHVMVVHDDPLQRKLADYHLSGAGFRVTLVSDATQAVERALSVHPDAVVSALLMPGLNGFELCLDIRTHAALASIPVVLISSFRMQDSDQRLAARVGANAIVDQDGDWLSAVGLVRDALSEPAVMHAIRDTAPVRRAIQQSTSEQLQRQLGHKAALNQQCQLNAAQLSVLAGVADTLARNSKLDGVLEDVLALCFDIAGISKGALYLRAAQGFVAKHTLGFSSAESEKLCSLFGRAELLARLIADAHVTTIPSEAVGGELAQAILQTAGVNSALIVRVAWGESVHGALFLGARDADVTTKEPATFARVLGTQMGQAIGLADAFERLATSEERFRTLVASMDDVIVTNLSGGVTGAYGREWNSAGAERWLGKALPDLPGPDQRNLVEQAYERARAGESVSYEWSRGTGSDSHHYIDALWPVRAGAGQVASVVRVRRDISQEKRLQAQVMTADRMVSVGMLAAGAAHEINNPLLAVLGNLELIRDALAGATPSSDDLREPLRDALEGGKRVEAIVRDLRLFSRAEEERGGGVDLELVLQSTLRLAHNEIRHRARLVQDFRAHPRVRGNESRLGQLFLNLIVNAAQAIPEGRADTNEIRICVQLSAHGHAVVEISDTGSGIPEDIAKQLFVPFVTTKPVGVGTGLGLSICQRIVTNLGGEISFESQVGHGTTFRVSLPVDTATAVQQPTSGPPAKKSTMRGRIAVIDDDATVVSLMKRVLQRDHEVVAFADASTALAEMEHDRAFGLILCDLMMPVVNGLEFYKRLRLLAPELAERTVFLTGGAFTDEARQFLEGVPNLSITKPFGCRS